MGLGSIFLTYHMHIIMLLVPPVLAPSQLWLATVVAVQEVRVEGAVWCALCIARACALIKGLFGRALPPLKIARACKENGPLAHLLWILVFDD